MRLVQRTALYIRFLFTAFQEGAGDVFLRLADTRQVLQTPCSLHSKFYKLRERKGSY
jgi:hypothetical protein